MFNASALGLGMTVTTSARTFHNGFKLLKEADQDDDDKYSTANTGNLFHCELL